MFIALYNDSGNNNYAVIADEESVLDSEKQSGHAKKDNIKPMKCEGPLLRHFL